MAMDQKKLRELMKAEREQRGGAKPTKALDASARPTAGRLGTPARHSAVAVASNAVSPLPPQRAPESTLSEILTPESSGGLLNGYGGDSDEEQTSDIPEPPAKRSKPSDSDSRPGDSLACGSTEGVTDASMPPPAGLPSRLVRKMANEAVAIVPLQESAAEDSIATATSLLPAIQASDGPDSNLETPSGSEEVLPPGFFDDPELDAKVRGVEAPGIRAQRELEDGLKRFAREMASTQEQAEETRHELDEEKYAAAAAEEQEFQTELEARLAQLRAKASALNQRQKDAAIVGGGAPAALDTDNASDDGDDGDDIGFDWRAKGFT